MKSAAKLLLSLFLLLSGSLALAQTPSSKTPGTISGRVTAGSELAVGVEVILKPGGNSQVTDILRSGPAITATTDSDGWFKFASVAPGSYRLVAYAPARDAGKNGITLKVGDKLNGLAVKLAEGAAGLKGKVVSTGQLPSRLRVHLLPAEPEAKDDLLRFAEAVADDNGSFNFAHLAPGKYLLQARTIPDTEPGDKPANPVAWDALERAKLRKEAEAANSMVELKTCQRVTDFSLRWAK